MEILHRDEARHNFFRIDIDPEMSLSVGEKKRPFWKFSLHLLDINMFKIQDSILCKFRENLHGPCTPNCTSRFITLPNKMYRFVQANFPKTSTTTTLWWLFLNKKPGNLTFFQPSPSPPLGTNDLPFKTKRLGFGPPT